jgi:hypothetical protein
MKPNYDIGISWQNRAADSSTKNQNAIGKHAANLQQIVSRM